MKDRYILATDTFDSKVFSVCVFDRQKDLVIISENIFGEKEFEERVNQLSKHYNCLKKENIKPVRAYEENGKYYLTSKPIINVY